MIEHLAKKIIYIFICFFFIFSINACNQSVIIPNINNDNEGVGIIEDNNIAIHSYLMVKGNYDIIKDCTPELAIFTEKEDVISMSFSGNSEEWSEWVGYIDNYNHFNIASGLYGTSRESGLKTVYVRFRDIEDNIFPEKHQEASSMDVDLQNLKRKVDAGADVVVTQLFYENFDFFRFRDRCERMGIQVPIIPGIMPMTNLSQIRRISSMCGARLPEAFVWRLQENEDPDWQFQVGIDFAIVQVEQLVREGIAGVHFYVLNKSQAASHVMQAVRLPR